MIEGLFPLAIFPTGGLASSVIVPVWVGVMVIAFFNLRFGWVLSGLVVPGYLVPMIIVNPVLGAVNYVEALITLLLSMLVSNRLMIWANWSHFFGRDRFFLIVIVSIFVRLTLDTWVFDLLADFIFKLTGQQFSFRNDLHSFGLIIIALMSNQMWKTGILRGSFHLFVTVGITLVIVRFMLMPFTNFSLTNLAFMYEEVSVAILASPKTYMILLVSCYIASRMNLRYGWEYAGILVPSLLAIQWYQPLKVAATFAETFIILILASLLLKSRAISNMDITGARKLILFFCVSFAYKFILAASLGVLAPYQKASDFFAFGYLLSTLIAIKMHDKKLTIGMTRTVLQSSLVALVIATALGFGLFKIAPLVVSNKLYSSPTHSVENVVIRSDRTLEQWLTEAKTLAYGQKASLTLRTYSLNQISRFRQVIELLTDYQMSKNPENLVSANAMLQEMGAFLVHLTSGYLLIGHETDVSFGTYVLSLKPTSKRLLIQAPVGLTEREAYKTSLALFKLSNASFLAISNGLITSGSTDLNNSNSMFSHFQMMTAKNNVVQVRTTLGNVTSKAERWSRGQSLEKGDVYAWVKNRIPDGFDLNQVFETANSLSINWFPTRFTNRQRDINTGGFLELLLDRATSIKLQALAEWSDNELSQHTSTDLEQGYLNDWLNEKKELISLKDSGLYRVPQLGEMLYFLDEAILELLELIDTEYRYGQWSELGLSRLRQLNQLISYFDYELVRFRDKTTGHHLILIHEKAKEPKLKAWGTYLFNLDADSNFVLEVPRPRYEKRTFELGVHIFRKLNAKALLIAGAHPQSTSDASSDVLKLRNRRSLFNTMHYGLSKYHNDSPLHFVQIRSMTGPTQEAHPTSDVVIESNLTNVSTFSNLTYAFTEEGMSVKSMNEQGESVTPVYTELGLNSQSAQLRYQQNKAFSIAWVAPEIRERFRTSGAMERVINQLDVSHVQIIEVDVASHINSLPISATESSEYVKDQLLKYVSSHNIIYLQNALDNQRLSLRGLKDSSTDQLFLEVTLGGRTVAIVNINPLSSEQTQMSSASSQDIFEFVHRKFVWLDLVNR